MLWGWGWLLHRQKSVSQPSPDTFESGTKNEPKPKLLSPDIFRWGRGLPHEGVGAKKFGMPLETREIKLFWRDIPGFCRDIPGVPEKFENKKFGFNFRSLLKSTPPVSIAILLQNYALLLAESSIYTNLYHDAPPICFAIPFSEVLGSGLLGHPQFFLCHKLRAGRNHQTKLFVAQSGPFGTPLSTQKSPR